MKFTKTFLLDLLERVVSTFGAAFAAVALTPLLDGKLNVSVAQQAAVAGLAAVASLVKGLAASQLGNKDSASLITSIKLPAPLTAALKDLGINEANLAGATKVSYNNGVVTAGVGATDDFQTVPLDQLVTLPDTSTPAGYAIGEVSAPPSVIIPAMSSQNTPAPAIVTMTAPSVAPTQQIAVPVAPQS